MSRPVVIDWPGWRGITLAENQGAVETSPGVWQIPFNLRPYGDTSAVQTFRKGGLYVGPEGRINPFAPWIFPGFANIIELSTANTGDYDINVVLSGTDIWGNYQEEAVGALPFPPLDPFVSTVKFATVNSLTVTPLVDNPGPVLMQTGGVMKSRVISTDYNRRNWAASFHLERGNADLGISVYVTAFPTPIISNMHPVDPYMFANPNLDLPGYAILNTGTELIDFSPVPVCTALWVEATAQDVGQEFYFAFLQQGVT